VAEFTLPPNSRIKKGKHFSAGEVKGKVRQFVVYRYDPSSGDNPRMDTFEIDMVSCGPLVLDALIMI
jgi:succinate dehydrogenase / fumarate reductase iron-sulfur subunit